MAKQMSEQAQCAKLIRKDLKEAFPSIKFSVKSNSFSGGDSVDIYWTNGPTTEMVDHIVSKYQYGQFDGMTDYYDITNNIKDLAQVKYVMTSREFTDEIRLSCAKAAQSDYGDLEDVKAPETKEDLEKTFTSGGEYLNWFRLTYRILNKLDLTDAVGVEVDPNFEAGFRYAGFRIVKGDSQ